MSHWLDPTLSHLTDEQYLWNSTYMKLPIIMEGKHDQINLVIRRGTCLERHTREIGPTFCSCTICLPVTRVLKCIMYRVWLLYLLVLEMLGVECNGTYTGQVCKLWLLYSWWKLLLFEFHVIAEQLYSYLSVSPARRLSMAESIGCCILQKIDQTTI